MNTKWTGWLPALLIVALGAYLRLAFLASIPAWYPDEGSNIAIAAALARGEQAYLVFGQSSFINSHPHLFYLLTAALFRLRGVDILWARLVAVGGGLLTLILLYPVGRALLGRGVALLAMLVYAIHPGAWPTTASRSPITCSRHSTWARCMHSTVTWMAAPPVSLCAAR